MYSGSRGNGRRCREHSPGTRATARGRAAGCRAHRDSSRRSQPSDRQACRRWPCTAGPILLQLIGGQLRIEAPHVGFVGVTAPAEAAGCPGAVRRAAKALLRRHRGLDPSPSDRRRGSRRRTGPSRRGCPRACSFCTGGTQRRRAACCDRSRSVALPARYGAAPLLASGTIAGRRTSSRNAHRAARRTQAARRARFMQPRSIWLYVCQRDHRAA